MPPNFPPQPPDRRPGSVPVPSPPQHEQISFHSPPLPQPKPLPAAAKSHSIFTPIDDSRSLLAQHWGSSSTADVTSNPAATKTDGGPRAQSIDVASMGRKQANGRSTPQPQPPHPTQQQHHPHPQRTVSSSSVPKIPPPSRTNSMQAKPRLKVQIPSEASDGGETTADASPRDTAATATMTPVRANGEGPVVLPPPSPSASALLSAGASGPPNPFARPAPPSNTSNYNNRNDMETPISALPSRFVSDQLLPSPSSFYPEWGFGRQDNMLPSPLTFQTPVAANGPSFKEQDETDRKRKTSDGSDGGQGKRIRT